MTEQPVQQRGALGPYYVLSAIAAGFALLALGSALLGQRLLAATLSCVAVLVLSQTGDSTRIPRLTNTIVCTAAAAVLWGIATRILEYF